MQTGTAKRLMLFIDESDRWHGHNLVSAIIDKLRSEGCSGATVLRGMQGFGVHGQIHTSTIVDLAAGLPVVIIAIDDADKIDRVLPKLEEMVEEGLIVVDEVEAVRRNHTDQVVQKQTGEQTRVEHMVAEYMDETPITLSPDTKVSEIVEIFLNKHRTHLPVVNSDSILLGMVSSPELLGKVVHIPQGAFRFFSLHGQERLQVGEDIRVKTASEVMRTHITAVEANTPMVKAVQIMLHDHLSALPVVEGRKLVGILRLPEVLQKALSVEYPSG